MLQKVKSYYLLYIIPIPIFFTLGGVYKGSSIGDDTFALPISLVFLLFSVITNKKYIKVLFQKENTLLLLLLLYSIIVFLLKIFFSSSSANPNLLFVSIIPFVISFSIGYSLKPDLLKSNLTLHIGKAIQIFAIFSLAHLVSSFISFGAVGAFANRGEDSIFGLFSIYQKFVYYPTMLASFFILSLSSSLRYKYVYSIVFLVSILITGSREGILISVLGILLTNISHFKKITVSSIFKGIIILVILSTLVIYFIEPIRNILDNAVFLNKLSSLSASGDVTAGRSGALALVFENSKKDFNLLIGTGYSMSLGDFRSPHNQYAEILLRSGVFGLIIFLLLMVRTLRNMLINVRHLKHTDYNNIIYAFAIVFLCFIFVSFNINVPVRAPYTAILFGFLCGFLNEKKSLSKLMFNYSVK